MVSVRVRRWCSWLVAGNKQQCKLYASWFAILEGARGGAICEWLPSSFPFVSGNRASQIQIHLQKHISLSSIKKSLESGAVCIRVHLCIHMWQARLQHIVFYMTEHFVRI